MRFVKLAKSWLVKRSGYLAGIGLVLLTIGIYLPGLWGPFVFDDLTNIGLVQALRIESLDYDSLRGAALWQKADIGSGRPIAMMSFALNYYFAGLDTFGYKAANLFIHIVNAFVLWYLALRLLRRISANRVERPEPRNKNWVALAIAGLWVVHPLNLTSVLYIVQRMTSLASLFILLGLVCYTLGRDQLAAGKRIGFLTTAGGITVFGALALLTKEIGLLLPLYALVIEATCYRFAAKEPMKRAIRGLWVLVGAAVAIAVLVKFDLVAQIFSYQYRDFTAAERLLTEARALWLYIKLIFLPTISELGIYHDDVPLSHDLFDPTSTVFAVTGVLGLVIVAIASYRRAPVLAFGLCWFLAGHTLESSLLPLELIHEHRNYLPQFGLLFSFVWYALAPFARLRKTMRIRQGFIALCLALFSSVTFARALDWKDEWTLYTSDVKNHPNSASARTMLAIILHDNGQDVLAHEQFVVAANVRTSDSRTMLRLVQHTYLTSGKIPEAMLDELELRLRTHSYSNTTLWVFEPFLRQTKRDVKLNRRLIRMYEALVQRTDVVLPTGWQEHAFQTLGFAFRETGDYRSALAYFTRALELSTTPANYLLAASMHLKLGQIDDAEKLVNLVLPSRATLDDDDRARLQSLEAVLSAAGKTGARR